MRAWKGWKPAEPAWPGGQPSAAIRKARTVSTKTGRLRLAQNLVSPLSSPLLSEAAERDSPESGARGQWPPSAKLSDQGIHQRALTPSDRPVVWWCVCVSTHHGALCAQTLPLLFLFAGHPSPTPICFCQMRKSPRKTQTLQRPRAPFGTWQHAAAGYSAQLGGSSLT